MASSTSNKSTNKNTTKKSNDKKEDIEQVKVMAALAYFGILFFLPLVTYPESKFGKFHANQGLNLLITALAINMVGTFLPIIGWFIILPLGNLFLLVLFIIGLVNALNKEEKRLPLVGSFELIK